MLCLRALTVSLILVFASSDLARGSTVVISFSGVVSELRDPLRNSYRSNFDGIEVGQRISGSYAYDDDLPPLYSRHGQSGEYAGYYWDREPYGMHIEVGDLTFDSVPVWQIPPPFSQFTLEISIYDDWVDENAPDDGPVDSYAAGVFIRDLDGIIALAQLSLSDRSLEALEDVALSSGPPSLEVFPEGHFWLIHLSGYPAVIATLDSLSSTIVPEPSVGAFVVGAIVCVLGRRSKTRTMACPGAPRPGMAPESRARVVPRI